MKKQEINSSSQNFVIYTKRNVCMKTKREELITQIKAMQDKFEHEIDSIDDNDDSKKIEKILLSACTDVYLEGKKLSFIAGTEDIIFEDDGYQDINRTYMTNERARDVRYDCICVQG